MTIQPPNWKLGTSNAEDGIPIPLERSVDFCHLFVDGKRLPGTWKPATALAEAKKRDAFVSMSLNEPTTSQMEKIAELFDIDELIITDILEAQQRPKVESYEEQLFMVLRPVIYSPPGKTKNSQEIIRTGEVHIVIGKHFFILVRHGLEIPQLFDRLNLDIELETHEPMAQAWTVADLIIKQYVKVSDQLSGDVTHLEEEVFTPKSQFNIEPIYIIKRETLEMRNAINPLGPALMQLLTNPTDLLNSDLRSYFRDLLDNLTIADDGVSSFDERLSNLIDVGSALVGIQQNQDMRAISAVVGMFAAPTLIAGIYGMNFANMPELQYKNAYYVVLVVMVVISVLLFAMFKKYKWL